MNKLEELIQRLKECDEVINSLHNSSIWNILKNDCEKWVKEIDCRWQDANEEQIKIMRIQKLAYNHVLNVKNKYEEEAKMLREGIELMNDDNRIAKDFDNEGMKEEGVSKGNYGI